ncbi:HNH endonuclease [Nocardia ninae]|uniref:Uncharacterized protein n=1 Tax=Nocardia ninae NBRC 108245 TaxID=1210091 RepID=A0A511MMT5_9NOCA|nr:hypothetical protein NN4_64590 [Nocardia ninae NBRC 108245]
MNAIRALASIAGAQPGCNADIIERVRQYGRSCLSCEVPLLPVARVSELPQWVRRHRGRGLCDSCYSAAARAAPRKAGAPPSHCRGCCEPLITRRQKRDGAPGKVHDHRGLCARCSSRVRRSSRAAARAAEPVRQSPVARLAAIAGVAASSDAAEYERAAKYDRRCRGCAATLTQSRSKQLPQDLKRHRGQGFCNACYIRERTSGRLTTVAPKGSRPAKCIECQRPLVTRKQQLNGETGALHRAGGMCATCHKRAERDKESEKFLAGFREKYGDEGR